MQDLQTMITGPAHWETPPPPYRPRPLSRDHTHPREAPPTTKGLSDAGFSNNDPGFPTGPAH